MSKAVIACQTDALDDWKFDVDGHVISPGGEPVAIWLFEALSEKAEKLTPPHNHKNFGWSFDLAWGGKRFWLLIAQGPSEETMYVWVEPGRSWTSGIFRRPDLRQGIFGVVIDLLKGDPRFQNVRIETPPLK